MMLELEGKLEHCEILIRMLMSVESARPRSKVSINMLYNTYQCILSAARKEETKLSHGRPHTEELVIIARSALSDIRSDHRSRRVKSEKSSLSNWKSRH